MPGLYEAPEGTKPPPFWIRGVARAHVHGRELRARIERRPKGHGPDHADPHRHRPDGVRAQPRHARARGRRIYRRVEQAQTALDRYASGPARRPRAAAIDIVRNRIDQPANHPALARWRRHREGNGELRRSKNVPAGDTATFATKSTWSPRRSRSRARRRPSPSTDAEMLAELKSSSTRRRSSSRSG